MQRDDAASAWVHAFLRGKEGVDGDAGCWYRRARRRPARGALARGWGRFALALLCGHKPSVQKPATLADSVCDTIKLVDGRRLGWAEFGDPQGLPLFSFHFLPRPAWRVSLIEGAALRNGIRVIGVGPPRVRDLRFPTRKAPARLALRCQGAGDRLSIDRFMVLGVSGGGPYALACAHAMEPRLRAVGVVCGLGPVSSLGPGVPLPWPARLGFGLARSKRLLRLFYGGATAWVIKHRPEALRRC